MARILTADIDTDARSKADQSLGGPIPIGRGLDRGHERRRERRHDLAPRAVEVSKWDGFRNESSPLGVLMDLSAGGARIDCDASDADGIVAGSHLRVRLQLPDAAGISPFVHAGTDGEGSNPMSIEPANSWTGWMEVARVSPPTAGYGKVELAGRLLDMADLDRGMLKLYLSIHPLAA